MKRVAGYRSHPAFALFVFDAAIHQPYQNRSNLLMTCDLEFRFLPVNFLVRRFLRRIIVPMDSVRG